MKLVAVLGNFFRPERLGAPSVFGAYYVNADYYNAFTPFQVLPVSVPFLEQDKQLDVFVDMLDGLVFTGGFDVPPQFFGQQALPNVESVVDHARMDFEVKLLERLNHKQKPILGICLGMQVYNVFKGGDMLQDLPTQKPSEIDHRTSADDGRILAHTVKISPNSAFSDLLKGKKELMVNSVHHQAVDRLGKGLQVVAQAEDGVIEAIESDDKMFFGVQWHPEALQQQSAEQRLIFANFVDSL